MEAWQWKKAPTPSGPSWAAIWATIFGRFSPRAWQAALGVSVLVVSALWDSIPEFEKQTASLQPVHLLWLLSWLKQYSTFETHALHWHCDPKTFHHRVMQVLELLNRHLDLIHLDARLDDGPSLFDLGYIVVDACLCPVQCDRKLWANQKPFFSVKHGCHGLKYEIAVHWRTGRIVWVAGGVPGSTHDLVISRHSGLLAFLRMVGEFAFGDKGYVGEEGVLLCPYKGRPAELSLAQLVWNRAMNPHRTIVENAFGRITKFNILQHKFRGELWRHPDIFRACAQIAQLDIFFHPLRADELEFPERHAWFVEEE